MKDLIEKLRDVGAGTIPHKYMGSCPDAVEGPNVRDEECPACQVLIAADRVIAGRNFVYVDAMGDSDLLARLQEQAERAGRSDEFCVVSCCTKEIAGATEGEVAAVLANANTRVQLKS